jgi:hypothetical protein
MSGQRRVTARRCAGGVLVLLAQAIAPGALPAQLVSPGPLSAPHAELQGLRRCTACHQLGQRGASADRCLECHAALRARLEAGTGYHATVTDRGCGSCHAEHYGREFALVRLDTAAFDHGGTGYELRDAHVRAGCRSCHNAALVGDAAVRREKKTRAALDRTFLGLGRQCTTCHAADDPHGRQFRGRSCNACHGEERWDAAPRFDHDQAGFRITGRHADAACAGCHTTEAGVVRYRGVLHETCGNCHADPHRGSRGRACATCHETRGWEVLGAGFDPRSFDHGTTRFALRGAHVRVDCGGCHRVPARSDARIRVVLASSAPGARYPRPIVRDCRSCHVQAHPGSGPDRGAGGNCVSCHGEAAWVPALFGSREHAETRFPLEGAHLLLACGRCHTPAASGRIGFGVRDMTCVACHAAANPHGVAYANASGITFCERCHTPRSWVPGQAEHRTFPLTGAHEKVSCASCHTPDRRLTPTDCGSCHGAADPHLGRSAGRSCGDCHETATFRTASRFDHGTTTYRLEGAHVGVPCRSCHVPEQSGPGTLVLRYTPLPTTCEACHGN